MKKYRVLFVCLGNICRSPAAEGIFAGMVKSENLENYITVDSAGTAGYHSGELPDLRMRRHGIRRGYSFESISRKFTVHDFFDFDIIIVMDDSNYHNVMQLAPDIESGQKVHRMVEFSQKFSHDHIPDPYYSGAEGFEVVLDLLEDACDGLLTKIKEGTI